MSKEGNMEELQRWSMEIVVKPGKYSYGNESVGYEHDPDGEWVRFSDVEEREARFQARIEELKQALDRYIELNAENKARIKELEVIVSGKTMYDAAAVADARWRERIERKAQEWEDEGEWVGNRVVVTALRSLLDSGEEKECPDDDRGER